MKLSIADSEARYGLGAGQGKGIAGWSVHNYSYCMCWEAEDLVPLVLARSMPFGTMQVVRTGAANAGVRLIFAMRKT